MMPRRASETQQFESLPHCLRVVKPPFVFALGSTSSIHHAQNTPNKSESRVILRQQWHKSNVTFSIYRNIYVAEVQSTSTADSSFIAAGAATPVSRSRCVRADVSSSTVVLDILESCSV